MTNSPKNIEHNYFYVLIEIGRKGYVLKEQYLPHIYKENEQEEYFKFTKLIDEKLYNGYTENDLLAELEPIRSYKILTHKAHLTGNIKKLWKVLCFGEAKNNSNTMYLIRSLNRIEDFSDLSRYDPSRHCIYLNTLKDRFNEDFEMEVYLN